MTVRLTLAGYPAIAARVIIPRTGAWVADVELESSVTVTGQCRLEIGDVVLRGTVVTAGAHTGYGRARIVGGAAGWGMPTQPQHYHDIAGVRARTVIDDAAREVGETIGDVDPSIGALGPDVVRFAAPASRMLELASPSIGWWIDLDGVTQIKPRTASRSDDAEIEVGEYDPRLRRAVASIDRADSIAPGMTLVTREGTEIEVGDVELSVDPVAGLEAILWQSSEDRLSAAIRRVVRHSLGDDRAFGVHRYRVFRMSGDDVELQRVRPSSGVPDLIPLQIWAGIQGWSADLQVGTEVHVCFEDGDPTLPFVSGFAPGASPQSATLSVATSLKLGGSSATKKAATAEDVLAEFQKVQLALNSANAPPGGGAVTYVTPYTAPGSAASIGASKVSVL